MRVCSILLAASVSALAADSQYAGAGSCAKCHADIQKHWEGSRHSRMVQPATAASVRGDFARGQITLRGEKYGLSARDGAYYITESYLSGRPRERRIDYTLGNRRIQHYLTTLADGRIIVLPPSWDIQREQWFHNFDIGDPDESGQVEVQLWNKGCFGCHVSQEQKNFDASKVEYKTTWQDFGVNCERCHGPAAKHVAAGTAKDIVVQTRLDAVRDTMVCAQCHSFRDIFVPEFKAGDNFYDHFVPILEFDQPVDKDPAYWADGRTRRFSTDAFGLWQSQCYLKGGATCLKCHVDAHDTTVEKSPQLRPEAAAICTQCHAAIAKNVAAHTHHPAASAGSSCVECHMPRTVLSIRTQIRDHSITVPVPENTTRHGIPNACSECHKDRDAAWAAARMDAWWGNKSRLKTIRRADAFVEARAGSAASIGKLLEIATDAEEGPFARANALGYLSRFWTDPRVFPIFEWAMGDKDPLPRAIAALRMPSQANRRAAINDLARGLRDPVATVRLGSLVSLVAAGVKGFTGEEGRYFAEARKLYEARAALNTDDAAQQFAAGRFFLLTGDAPKAAEALTTSLKIDPEMRAEYYLGAAFAQQAKYEEARAVLGKVGQSDPQYGNAQALLKEIAAK